MKNHELLSAISFLLLATTSFAHAADTPPNVVLIFADDLGYGDLGCYGATKVGTPNIDRLAAEGRRFTDAHSVSAVCTPSRFALLTGEYPLRGNGGRGVWGPAPITSPLIVDTEKTTVADVFKRGGYDTAVIGKWHLGFGNQKNSWREPLRPGPQDLGFDYYFGMPVVNSAPPYVYVENDRVVGSDPNDPLVYLGRNAKNTTAITPIPPEAAQRSGNVFGGAKEAHKIFNDYQVGTTLAKKSVEWIESRKENPFFLYLATTNIHHPFTPAKRFQGTSQCGLYGDFIHELDWIVGEILSCLEDNGLTENTLVIFTSDNGGMFNRGGQSAFKAGHRRNGDLLGFKFGVWEGGHRVPMIARWPGKVKAGTTSSQLIGNVDMLATFAAVTGQNLDKTQLADSVNMLPALVGEPTESIRDHLILAPHKGTHLSVRNGKWMYIPRQGSGGFGGRNPGDHGFAGPPAATFVGSVNSDIENGKYKADAPPSQLYDLESDVNQTRNVYHEYPEVVQKLTALLGRYMPQNARSAIGNGKPNPGPGKRSPQGNRAKKTPATPSSRSASWDFETGKIEPWKVVKGKFAHLIGSRAKFFRSQQDYNKQGKYYLTTLESAVGAEKGSDGQTGVIVSPLFIPEGSTMTFRVGGGRGRDTYVALCDADGKELKFARGINDQAMQNVVWDLKSLTGKTLFIKVVDQSTGGWGHVTVDDFQFDAKVLEEYPAAVAPRKASPNDNALQKIKHSFLACGQKTYIMGEDGKPSWTYPAPTRDGYVLMDGTIILTLSKSKGSGGSVVRIAPDGKETLIWKGTQSEVNSTHPTADGHFVVTEAGTNPRLLELNSQGKVLFEFPLACQKQNHHMQTRMARKLADGTYLAPHLLDFAVFHYGKDGTVLGKLDTTAPGDRDHRIHSWPFTAIRHSGDHTLVCCTHGNRVVDFDANGKIIWTLTNEDLPGDWLQDPCGGQVLPNGNIVITSYAGGRKDRNAPKLFEVTRDKKVVWTYSDGQAVGIHHFQILTTNGQALKGPILK